MSYLSSVDTPKFGLPRFAASTQGRCMSKHISAPVKKSIELELLKYGQIISFIYHWVHEADVTLLLFQVVGLHNFATLSAFIRFDFFLKPLHVRQDDVKTIPWWRSGDLRLLIDFQGLCVHDS